MRLFIRSNELFSRVPRRGAASPARSSTPRAAAGRPGPLTSRKIMRFRVFQPSGSAISASLYGNPLGRVKNLTLS